MSVATDDKINNKNTKKNPLLNINTLDATSEEISEIKKMVYTNKLVILKNQKMNEQEFCDFSNKIGEPESYFQDNYNHPDYPLIFVSSNVDIQVKGKKLGVARTGGYWHSDTAFYEDPIPFTILYPQIIPQKSKRTTMFIDLQKAYEDMPEALKNKIRDKRFIHNCELKYKVRDSDVGFDVSEILKMINEMKPPVIHPAVIRHPFTGQGVFYGTRGFTVGVDGLPKEESDALLSELFDFVEQEKFIIEFQWELGDIVIWDNRYLAHKAGRTNSANDPTAGDSVHEEDTLVYRIVARDGHSLIAYDE